LARLALVARRLLAGRPRLIHGSHPHRLRAGQGSEFLDHRRYRPGDDPRGIDWRATARSAHPQLRRHRSETGSDHLICIDRSASMGLDNGARWTLAVQLCAALGYLLLELGDRVGVLLFSDRVDGLLPLCRGRVGYTRLLRLLQQARTLNSGGESRLASCCSQIPRGSQIIVISDLLPQAAMQQDLTRLTTLGETLLALQPVITAGIKPPATGSVTLQEIESGRRLRLDLDANAIEQVTTRQRRLDEQLRQHCRLHRIELIQCPTNEGWRPPLLRLLLPGERTSCPA